MSRYYYINAHSVWFLYSSQALTHYMQANVTKHQRITRYEYRISYTTITEDKISSILYEQRRVNIMGRVANTEHTRR